jgi:hypothetical protein
MQRSLPPSPDQAQYECPTGLPASTIVIVRVRAPADATMDDLRKVSERARDFFAGMPGLRRKYFSYSSERHEVVNVYVWHDSAAAAQVGAPDFVAKIRAVYAGEPEVTVAEVLAIAESTRGHDPR